MTSLYRPRKERDDAFSDDQWTQVVATFDALPIPIQAFASDDGNRVTFDLMPEASYVGKPSEQFFRERICLCNTNQDRSAIVIVETALDKGKIDRRVLIHELTHAMCRYLSDEHMSQLLFHAVTHASTTGEKVLAAVKDYQKRDVAALPGKYKILDQISALDHHMSGLPIVMQHADLDGFAQKVKTFLVKEAGPLSKLVGSIHPRQPLSHDGQCLAMCIIQHLSVKNARKIIYPHGHPNEETLCFLNGADPAGAAETFKQMSRLLSEKPMTTRSYSLMECGDSLLDVDHHSGSTVQTTETRGRSIEPW